MDKSLTITNMVIGDMGEIIPKLKLMFLWLIHWPNKEAKKYYHKSLHYDIIPSLLSENQACLNDYDDYAIGKSLC